jgi:hypothetical protein
MTRLAPLFALRLLAGCAGDDLLDAIEDEAYDSAAGGAQKLAEGFTWSVSPD